MCKDLMDVTYPRETCILGSHSWEPGRTPRMAPSLQATAMLPAGQPPGEGEMLDVAVLSTSAWPRGEKTVGTDHLPQPG